MISNLTKWDNDENKLREAVRYCRLQGGSLKSGKGFKLQNHLFLEGKKKLKVVLSEDFVPKGKRSHILFETKANDSQAYAEIAEFLDNLEFYTAEKVGAFGFTEYHASLNKF